MSSSYHNDLIKIQTKNLFDVPLDVETSFDNDNNMNGVDMSQVEIGAGFHPMSGGGRKSLGGGNGMGMGMKNVDFEMNASDDEFDEVDLNNINESGQVEFLQRGGGDPQLFDKIELQRDDSPSPSISLDKTDFTETIVPVKDNFQTGGGIGEGSDNMEMEIEELDLNENNIEEYGNVDNPGEDAPNADDELEPEYEVNPLAIATATGPPPTWIHPELNIENDDDMINKMNQVDIDAKVAMYLDYYNSDEYSMYLKYFQIIHSASHQKYSVRRDIEGNIYLIKRTQKHQTNDNSSDDDEDEKDKKDKKDKNKKKKDLKEKGVKQKNLKESVQDIINDSGFKKNYMIKLSPPEYLNIKEELSRITTELNILSGEIKLIQNDLIELGMDIKNEDIKRFEKIRSKFYKLINKKAIYSRYFYEVNNLPDDTDENPEINNIYVNELIGYENENDIKAYKLQSNLVKAPTMLIDNIILQLKDNLENFSAIIETPNIQEKQNEKKDKTVSDDYKSKIKTFLINKKINDEKTQKELDALINLSKAKINFIIKKLPTIDVKSEPN
jgi:hypothetical protein